MIAVAKTKIMCIKIKINNNNIIQLSSLSFFQYIYLLCLEDFILRFIIYYVRRTQFSRTTWKILLFGFFLITLLWVNLRSDWPIIRFIDELCSVVT